MTAPEPQFTEMALQQARELHKFYSNEPSKPYTAGVIADCIAAIEDLQKRVVAVPDDWRMKPQFAPAAQAVLAPSDCDWPDEPFSFRDEPGEHDPCYVVMPGGAMLPLNHHAAPGVDIARAKFIVDACNTALSPDFPRAAVAEAMQDAWNTICTDTDCHPLDIERRGKELFFKPGHWADLVALFLSRSPSLPSAQAQAPMDDRAGIEWFERTFGVPLGDKPGAVDVERVRAAAVPSAERANPDEQETNAELCRVMLEAFPGPASSLPSAQCEAQMTGNRKIIECPRCNEGDERRIGFNVCGLCECQFYVRPDGSLFTSSKARRIGTAAVPSTSRDGAT